MDDETDEAGEAREEEKSESDPSMPFKLLTVPPTSQELPFKLPCSARVTGE